MTLLAGIVNLTPDSFSGDGIYYSPQKALEKIDAYIKDGVGIIDIGAESTRPGAQSLSADEEWERLAPLMDALASRSGQSGFSIDTRHAETAQKFLSHFPEETSLYVNCVVSQPDDALLNAVKRYNARLIIMHSLTLPADPKVTIPENKDAVEVVCEWARELIVKWGRDIIIDPGIGFGKTAQQSWALIKSISRIKALGAEVMVGHSRKSFLTLFTDKKALERDPETLIISDYLAGQGVDYLRVHDIKSHAAMLKIRKNL